MMQREFLTLFEVNDLKKLSSPQWVPRTRPKTPRAPAPGNARRGWPREATPPPGSRQRLFIPHGAVCSHLDAPSAHTQEQLDPSESDYYCYLLNLNNLPCSYSKWGKKECSFGRSSKCCLGGEIYVYSESLRGEQERGGGEGGAGGRSWQQVL